MTAVDINILIYARDPRDPDKQAMAISLLSSLSDGVLLWQVACEYLAASRKLGPFGYTVHQAWKDLEDLRDVWHTALPTWSTLDRAKALTDRFHLSHWDSLIVAACIENRVERLYSEDFDAYSLIDGLSLINPFSEQPIS